MKAEKGVSVDRSVRPLVSNQRERTGSIGQRTEFLPESITKWYCAVLLFLFSFSPAWAQSTNTSTNIVGYATLSLSPGYNLIANPLSCGITNGANEIGLQIPGVRILTWNAATAYYNLYLYDPSLGGWVDANLNPTGAPSLPPGLGFFLFNPLPATNITFIGEVVPGPSETNCLTLAPGYNLLGSRLPANVSDIAATPVRLPLLDGMQVLTWDASSFTSSAWLAAFGGWVDSSLKPKQAPAYQIGEGFFLLNPDTASWCQSLP